MGISDTPQVLFGKVMHARLFPKENAFRYGIYYISLPLSKIDKMPLSYNRFAAMSFYDRDHGDCDGSSLQSWAKKALKKYGISKADGEITLLCMPRVFGYVFNPVSFWICQDKKGDVRAVICEVHNTFGERHSYICAHPDQRPIKEKDVLKGDKLFHVSPFMEREGHYTFRFDFRDNQFGAWIDFFGANGEKKLITSLVGDMQEMHKPTLRRAFWAYPLVTFKAIALIHWQAVKIVLKGIKYIPKPAQKRPRHSATEDVKKI